jgi:formyltetrahydrofolate deformylase
VHGRLLVSCPDRPGIVAAVAGFLHASGANITSSAQHSGERFHMRMEFDAEGDLATLRDAFTADVAASFGMTARFADASIPPRMAILVSREEHCLLDLLWRRRSGELFCEVPVVISNHEVARDDVEGFGVPFAHVPNTPEQRAAAEDAMLAHLADVDLVVLARYMQILSGEFLARVGAPVMNIHHSFLPAFAGAGPYERARDRGVKLIGATAHYATEDLDEGPIIEQDVIRVSHRDSAEELERRGADVERTVLARAVQWHCEDRVVVDGSRTVVF